MKWAGKAWLLGVITGDVARRFRRTGEGQMLCLSLRRRMIVWGTKTQSSFIPVVKKMLLKINKQSIYKHLEDNKVIKNSLRGFGKNKPCQASFTFYS